MKYKIDVVRIRENSIQLNGWVIGKTPESKAEFEVLDQNKKPLEIKCVATRIHPAGRCEPDLLQAGL